MAHWPARGGAGVSATPGIAFGPSGRGLVVRRHPLARQASVAGRDSFYRGRARSPLGIGRGPCRVHLPRDGIVHPDGLNRISLEPWSIRFAFAGSKSMKRLLTWAVSL